MLNQEQIAAAVPSYEIGGEIGRGAWGVVVRATHRQLGREVAIKQLPQAFASDRSVRHRFVTEARLLATLDHPHIVPIFDYVEREGLCLLVMELLPGGTVWGRFTTSGLTMEAACSVALAAAGALGFAHDRGILHRDVKPENLLFTASDIVKVSDFGIAKIAGGNATMATVKGEVLGTPAYMSPEQAMGQVLTPATDLYALGTVLFELLSGRLPFSDDGNALALLHRHVYEQPVQLDSVAPDVPPGLCDVVMRCLAKDPKARCQSAEEFGIDLADATTAVWGPRWHARSGLPVMASEAVAARLSAPRPKIVSKRTSGPTIVDPPSSDALTPSAPPADGPGPSGRMVRPSDPEDHASAPLPATPSGVVPLASLVADAAPASPISIGWPATREEVEHPPPGELPEELVQAMNNPLPGIREAAVAELARLAAGSHAGRAEAAMAALRRFEDDDSRRVATAAAAARQRFAPPRPPPVAAPPPPPAGAAAPVAAWPAPAWPPPGPAGPAPPARPAAPPAPGGPPPPGPAGPAPPARPAAPPTTVTPADRPAHAGAAARPRREPVRQPVFDLPRPPFVVGTVGAGLVAAASLLLFVAVRSARGTKPAIFFALAAVVAALLRLAFGGLGTARRRVGFLSQLVTAVVALEVVAVGVNARRYRIRSGWHLGRMNIVAWLGLAVIGAVLVQRHRADVSDRYAFPPVRVGSMAMAVGSAATLFVVPALKWGTGDSTGLRDDYPHDLRTVGVLACLAAAAGLVLAVVVHIRSRTGRATSGPLTMVGLVASVLMLGFVWARAIQPVLEYVGPGGKIAVVTALVAVLGAVLVTVGHRRAVRPEP